MGRPRITAVPIAVLLAAAVAEGQERPAAQPVEPAPMVVQASSAPLTIPSIVWADPPARRVGVVTLMPPDTRGQFVRAVVPVGELAMRAGRAVAVARHRRAERTAHEAVVRALHDYLAPR